MTEKQPGVCPNCDGQGYVGEPCAAGVCSRKGFHIIPPEHFEAQQARPFHGRDPAIGLVVGNYLLVDLIGQGGFGKIYLALQLPIFLKAALKLMSRTVDEPAQLKGLLKRFQTEAANLARLQHPNIVKLQHYGTFNDLPFLVMEYVGGGRTLRLELKQRVKRNQPMDSLLVQHILEQLLNALEEAHSNQVIHRDIKPENIMLQHVAGDEYFVKVLDFGLSKFTEKSGQSSMVMGTPTYMAPEQITKKSVGPWTDLYAVGVLTFQLLTGHHPFKAQSTEEILYKKLNYDYDPLKTLVDPDLPGELLAFLGRAVARDHTERFQSVDEFRLGLRALFRTGFSTANLRLEDLLDNEMSSREYLRVSMRRILSERGRSSASSPIVSVGPRKASPADGPKYSKLNRWNDSDDHLTRQARSGNNRKAGAASRESEAAATADGKGAESLEGPAGSAPEMPADRTAELADSPFGSPLSDGSSTHRLRWIALSVCIVGAIGLALYFSFRTPEFPPDRVDSPQKTPGDEQLVVNKVPPAPLPKKPTTELPPRKPALKPPIKLKDPQKKPAVKPGPIEKPANLQKAPLNRPQPPKNPGLQKQIQLRIVTRPAGARLLVNRKPFGVTPKEWSSAVLKQRLRVSIRKRGYLTRVVVIRQDKSRTFVFRLKKKGDIHQIWKQ